MFNKIILGKKAQAGKTVTWMVATIVIVVILFSTIFVATLGPWGNKDVASRNNVDTLASKSFFSYLLTENRDGELVYNQLGDEEDFDEFSGELALNIFESFYGEEYDDVWMGTYSKEIIGQIIERIDRRTQRLLGLSNGYFGLRRGAVGEESRLRSPLFGVGLTRIVIDNVDLEGDRLVEFILDTRTN